MTCVRPATTSEEGPESTGHGLPPPDQVVSRIRDPPAIMTFYDFQSEHTLCTENTSICVPCVCMRVHVRVR